MNEGCFRENTNSLRPIVVRSTVMKRTTHILRAGLTLLLVVSWDPVALADQESGYTAVRRCLVDQPEGNWSLIDKDATGQLTRSAEAQLYLAVAEARRLGCTQVGIEILVAEENDVTDSSESKRIREYKMRTFHDVLADLRANGAEAHVPRYPNPGRPFHFVTDATGVWLLGYDSRVGTISTGRHFSKYQELGLQRSNKPLEGDG